MTDAKQQITYNKVRTSICTSTYR